jgi:hypothetical protein
VNHTEGDSISVTKAVKNDACNVRNRDKSEGVCHQLMDVFKNLFLAGRHEVAGGAKPERETNHYDRRPG